MAAVTQKTGATPAHRESHRRRHSKTARNGAFRCDEIEELTLASKLVPTGCNVVKPSVELEVASTAPPSSAGNSPDLACLPSDAEAWPSLPVSGEGWEFLNDADDKELWEDLPGPALKLEEGTFDEDDTDSENAKTGGSNWWLVPDSGADEATQAPAKASYADALKDSQLEVQPAPCQIKVHLRAPQASRSQRRSTPKASSANDASDAQSSDVNAQHTHGWTNHQKASWNKKLQRKVAAQKLRRMTQRCESHTQQEQESSLSE